MPPVVFTLGAIAAIWFAATMTPGPDFLVTTRTAMLHGRIAARRTILGLAVGTAAWGLAGFFGIHALFLAAPFLYVALKLGGGAYLIYLGVRLLTSGFARRSADRPEPTRTLRGGSAFRLGLMTNLANPKAALFTTSLFAATLPPSPPAWLGVAAAAIMTTICLCWYGLVAQALTTGHVAAMFARARRWIDRVAGAAFVGFGLELALDARRP
jgi:RhtB (resistance to homoserine/threonine) family protein